MPSRHLLLLNYLTLIQLLKTPDSIIISPNPRLIYLIETQCEREEKGRRRRRCQWDGDGGRVGFLLGTGSDLFLETSASDRDRNSVQSANQSKKRKVRASWACLVGIHCRGGEGLTRMTWAHRSLVLHRLLPRNLLSLHWSRPVTLGPVSVGA